MKHRAVPTYKPPRFPTYAESQSSPDLLKQTPNRWRSAKLAALFEAGLAGTLLVSTVSVTGCSKENVTAAPDSTDRRKGNDNDARAAAPAGLDLAPMLNEAIEKEGRGSFGCVAISAPSFLSEREALLLINQRLTEAGLTMSKETVSIPEIELPKGKRMIFFEGEEEEENAEKVRREKLVFDGAGNDGKVVFEYISLKDYHWVTPDRSMSSVSSYNFANAANVLQKSLADVDSDEDRIVGIFFDPLAGSRFGDGPIASPRARLLAQVDHFVEHLRKRKVISAKGAE